MHRTATVEISSFAPINHWHGDSSEISASKYGNFTHDIACNWDALREQVLQQWENLTSDEVEEAGPNRRRLAALIQRKYDINVNLVENYLRNFERVLPLM